jgi:hypothetical protein
MNVRKHAVLTRITTVVALFLTVLTLGSCKKEVTQVVDQAFSATYEIKPADWIRDTSNLNYYVANLNVPEVDNVVVGNGGVLVYLSFDNGVSFDALPEEVLGITYNAFHSKSTVTIGYRSVDGSVPQLPGGDYVLAKVVILDASPLPTN